MKTRRDMTGAEFRRALENQEFKLALGRHWYCSTREGTDETKCYGAFFVAGKLRRRETIRLICAAQVRHEVKLKKHSVEDKT